MNLVEELEKLKNLLDEEDITEEDYARAKSVLLEKHESGSKPNPPQKSFNIKEWSMMIHLSQFCGYFIPFAGFFVPIVLWQMKKDESPVIDNHGKIVTNWILREMIYLSVGAILCIIIIGIPMLIAIGIVSIIFPILGGIKANNGETWEYPMSIKFFKIGTTIDNQINN